MTGARIAVAGRLVLPRTDLAVSPLCLGGNRFGGELDAEASFAVLDAYVAGGGRFVDTAHVYADWVPGNVPSSSERTIGRWLAARRLADRPVIATKIGHPRLDEPGRPRLDAASLRADAEAARDHLGLPALDLVYLHRDDPARPVEDILTSLAALRDDGVVRHVGASNWTAARLQEAERVAAERGLPAFAVNQMAWSLAGQNPGAAAGDLAAMDEATRGFHARTGIAAVPYSSQAKGYFDKPVSALPPDTARLYDNAANRALARRLRAVADRHGATPTQVALAALRDAPFPTVPVVGCRTPAQVASSLASLALRLTPTDLSEIRGEG